MFKMQDYIKKSMELHLFFARIMKEHSLFLQAGFPLKNKNYIEEAKWFKDQFERLLLDIVNMSNNIIDLNILNSAEIVTEYTKAAEEKTEYLSGIQINIRITDLEHNLQSRTFFTAPELSPEIIKKINNHALELVNGLIIFKEKILNEFLICNIYTTNYPLLIEHILREAKLYKSYIIELETNHDIMSKDIQKIELFWNQIMMEHALFIRGLLDPSEVDLINSADNFANDYQKLLQNAKNATDLIIRQNNNQSLEETLKYQEFKTAGTKGIIEGKIKSIFLPLLADHVLREANHYIRILKENTNRYIDY
ncbi:MAG: DUF2935 domain-containing protein [Bacilli bacterium]|nr:DUF2935 domain-containing protein [Bacilli bacterium]MDD4407301.1 DUF2935 domain-containing protein [Bacilli bacterium]